MPRLLVVMELILPMSHQISDINIDLQKYNSELAIQKDLITKEYKLSPVKDSMKAKSDSDTKMDIM